MRKPTPKESSFKEPNSNETTSNRSPRNIILSVIAAIAAIVLGFFGISISDLFPAEPPAVSGSLSGSGAGSLPGESQEADALDVYFIDVGQADCILVRCGDETMLIDAGDQGSYPAISACLDGLGVTRLDYVIATHPHADHIGSMAKVIRNYDVGTVILPDIPEKLMPTTVTFSKMMEAIEEKECTVLQAEPLDIFRVGEAEVTILGPAGEYDDLNNLSVVCRLVFGETSFLFTGDAEARAEADILALNTPLRSTVLKMGHHGSSTSTSLPFWEAVDPLYCVISCGKDNDYGHPHRETLELLDEYQIIPYRTDTMGTVVFHVENGTVTVETGKKGA